ncbi:mitochondrial carnitine/acylcarnitine carrier-like protein isoform X2 [Setaria viridis]|uniref:mitochondrial carnitine/acylcarnitine carrier-like protein isoform X2 n=1 Tax=Setaria viridis TaxID=4556 RepID=UPI001493C9AD|nr:mitochondrial carnitine/acylcarnitine carrier-like protein isoform X2 [Setaria viridis]
MVVARWWWTGGLCFVGLWRLVASGPLVSRLSSPFLGLGLLAWILFPLFRHILLSLFLQWYMRRAFISIALPLRLVWRSAGPYVGGVESCSLGEEEAPVPGLLLHCRPPPLPHLSLHKTCAPQMGDVAKDLAAGTVGGAAQLVVGHPFDTIKVKLQSQPTPPPGRPPLYAGAGDAVRQTLAAEGARGLYKGMGAPLATVAAFNAVLFTIRGQMEAVLRSEPGVPLTVGQQVVAGAGAGVAVSFLACPTELIKCRLQAQSALAAAAPAAAAAGAGGAAAATVAAPAAAVKYGGPMEVARHVLRSEGGTRGLFKGLFPTLAREVPGNAIMFGMYEAIKQALAGGQDTSQLGRGSLILAGGLAGASFWGPVYPADVVKSVLQVDDYKNPKYSGSMDAFRKILAADGVKGLYKGFGPAMLRSMPANGACFLAYEVTRSALG